LELFVSQDIFVMFWLGYWCVSLLILLRIGVVMLKTYKKYGR